MLLRRGKLLIPSETLSAALDSRGLNVEFAHAFEEPFQRRRRASAAVGYSFAERTQAAGAALQSRCPTPLGSATSSRPSSAIARPSRK